MGPSLASSSAVQSSNARSLIRLGLFALAGFILLIGLGTWQMQRRDWKTALIAERMAAFMAPPMAEAPKSYSPEVALRHVRLTGHYLHEHELYLNGQSRGDSVGWHIITPLLLADGSAALIDRGFVPLEAKEPAKRPASQPAGEVTVTGVIRAPFRPGGFTPANQPRDNLWFYPDVPAMAAAASLTNALPYLIEADANRDHPKALPIGGQFHLEIPNDHLQYAITWYALAVILAAIYGLYVHKTLKAARV